MSYIANVAPHIDVQLTYKTRTPFLYCELRGTYQGMPINIAVVETKPGQGETITGVMYHQHDHDHDGRVESKAGDYWHASIRTSRLNLIPLFNRDHRSAAATADAAFHLTWTPEASPPQTMGECDHRSVIFGRFPELRPFNL